MKGICTIWPGVWLAILFLAALPLRAQEARVAEKELELQAAFIDAQREMILSRPGKAVPVLADLARKQPSNAGIAYAYAQALHAADDLPGALREIRRARKLDTANIWYAVTEGEYLEKAGAWGEAAELYRGLVERDPGEESHYMQWAFFLIKDGRSEEAIRVYDRLEKTLGPSTETSRRKYMLYRGMGKAREAAAVLESVLARQPRNTEVMFMLAEFYAESGATPEARTWYRRILELHPGNVNAQLALLQISESGEESGDPFQGLSRIFADPQTAIDQKVKAIIPHIQEYANHPEPLTRTRLEGLVELLDHAHPRDPKVAAIRGDLAFYSNEWLQAIPYYQQATMGDRQVYGVWEQMLRACSSAGQYRVQAEWAGRAADLFPNQGRIQFYLAEALVEGSRLDEALDAIRLGQIMARRDGYLLYHLAILEGRAHAALGEEPASGKAFDQALELHPRGPEALAWRSLAALSSAQACARAAEAAAVDPSMPMVRYAGARCALLKGDLITAGNVLESLAKAPFPHPAWLESLGDLRALEGDIEQALLLWSQALDLGHQSPGLQEKIKTRKYTK
jgi:tetratricopeptide (TPR) repeat protein